MPETGLSVETDAQAQPRVQGRAGLLPDTSQGRMKGSGGNRQTRV